MPLGRATACARTPSPAARRGRRALLVLALVLAATAARADEGSGALAVHRRVAQAWSAGNPAGITGAMRPGGTVRISLLLLDREGSYQRAQAERTLRAYFGKLSRIRLNDVTPRQQRDRGDYRVRTYEYTYKPAGQDPVTSLLVITLKADGNDRWHLEAVAERQKRPARR